MHATRRFLVDMPSDHVIAKFDFKNAFNTFRRDNMLEAIKHACPEVYNFCCSSYESKSMLFYEGHLLYSEEGSQQRDAMGPFKFSLALHQILETMKSSLIIRYLDDLTAGDDQQVVASDYLTLPRMNSEMGLKLHVANCEVITNDQLALDPAFSGFNLLNPCEGTLLGLRFWMVQQ